MTIEFFKGVAISFFLALLISCNSSDEPNQKKAAQAAQVESEPDTPAEYVEQATFTDLEGDTVSISKYKGKVILIDFWETWCKPCLASFPTMQKLQEEYPDDFAVLAVTPGFTDTKEDAQSFSKNHDYTFEYLIDSNNLHQQLGVQGIPFKVFVDANGNFIKSSMGTAGPEGDYEMIKEIIEKHKKS